MDEAELDAWAQALAAELGIDDPVDVTAVLALAATAAHTVVRPAAPVSTFVAGLLAGRSGDGAAALRRVADAVGQPEKFSRTESSD